MGALKYYFILGLSITMLTTACQQEVTDSEVTSASSSQKYLYIASGVCYSGTGNTTYTATTASNIIFRLNLDTGAYEGRIADFTTAAESTGTTPVSISDYSETHLMALLEHTGQRRIELIEKKLEGARQTYYSNTSATAPIGALQSTAKFLFKVIDGLLISRTTAIEKLDSGRGRQTGSGTNSWVQGPGGACSTSTVNITSLVTYPTSTNTAGYNIIYTHSQNASSATNNRIGVIDGKTGWDGAAGCLDDESTVAAAAYPTASVYMNTFKRLVVSYAGTNASMQNSIYSYAVDETATSNILSDAVNGYETPSVVYGASAMTYDEANGYLYVASGGAVAANLTTGNLPYKVEKFSFNPTDKKFTRVGSTSFYSGNFETRCISSMFIGN